MKKLSVKEVEPKEVSDCCGATFTESNKYQGVLVCDECHNPCYSNPSEINEAPKILFMGEEISLDIKDRPSANYTDRFGKTWYLSNHLTFQSTPPDYLMKYSDFPDRKIYYIKERAENESPVFMKIGEVQNEKTLS